MNWSHRATALGAGAVGLLLVFGSASFAQSEAASPEQAPSKEAQPEATQAPGPPASEAPQAPKKPPSPQEQAGVVAAPAATTSDSPTRGPEPEAAGHGSRIQLEALRQHALSEVRAARSTLRHAAEASGKENQRLHQQAEQRLERAERRLKAVHADRIEEFLARPPAKRRQLLRRIEEHRTTLEQDRSDRAAAHRKEWANELGGAQSRRDVRLALRDHAWRQARLEQAGFLARMDGRPELVARARALQEREQAAFDAHLRQLLASPPPKSDSPAEDAR